MQFFCSFFTVEIDEFKSICDIQIIAITELKMTVELPVNITKPLYDKIPIY